MYYLAFVSKLPPGEGFVAPDLKLEVGRIGVDKSPEVCYSVLPDRITRPIQMGDQKNG
jgi:hypothetical protein